MEIQVSDVIVKERLDPALEKFLDTLFETQEEPRRPKVQVSCCWCEPVHIIDVGEWVELDFSTWYGPTMKIREVPVVAREIDGFRHVRIGLEPVGLDTINPHDELMVRVRVVFE